MTQLSKYVILPVTEEELREICGRMTSLTIKLTVKTRPDFFVNPF